MHQIYEMLYVKSWYSDGLGSQRSLGKARARFLLLAQKPVLYQLWAGMVKAYAVYRSVREKSVYTAESLPWQLNRHHSSEN